MAAQEEREAFLTALYQVHASRLRRMGQGYVGREEQLRDLVEPCLQETFAVAAGQYEQLKTHPAVEGWLVATFLHRLRTAVDTQRRRQKRQLYSLDEDAQPALAEQTLSAIDRWMAEATAQAQVEQILQLLNQREQTVFQQSIWGDKPLQQLADEQGESLSAVKSVAARLRRKIRDSKIFQDV